MNENQKKEMQCRYFRWLIYLRDGVYQADGRSNQIDAGRRSLRTRKWEVAKKQIHKLDEKMAEKLGLIRFSRRENDVNFKLTIQEGIEVYLEFTKLQMIAESIAESTLKRYKRSINSFSNYVAYKPIQYWEQFDAGYMTNFVEDLRKRYKRRSVVTIATTIRTLHRHLIAYKHLDDRCAFPFAISRPKESTKYCPSGDEVRAILGCLKDHEWIYDVTTTLNHSGLRFGELAQLSPFDADLKESLIHVRDETFETHGYRKTKSGYSRFVPMLPRVQKIIARRLEQSNELLYVGPKGGKLRSDTFGRNLRRLALQPLQKKFPDPRFQTITAHSFRHFFASCCAANQTSEQNTMDWMGHRTSKMAKYYYRSNHKAAVKLVQQFEDFTEASPADDASTTNPNSEASGENTSK